MEEMNWGTGETVSTADLDAEVKKLIDLEKIYDEKKKIYEEADDQYENQRAKLLSMLQATGKTKYHVDGIGTVSMAIKSSVQVPKTPEDKEAMLNYFKEQGEEIYLAFVTVNSKTLNSYLNQQREENPNFKLPGVADPKETAELRFRKGK